jgi:deoxyxylulose-5-phosphate synthase
MGGTISLVTSCAKKNEERVELGFLSLLPTFMQDVLGFKYVASSNGNISDYSVIMTTVDDLSPQGIINASTPSGMGYIYSNSQNLAFIYYPQSGNDNTKSSNSNKEFEPEDQIKLFFNDLPQHSNVSIRC